MKTLNIKWLYNRFKMMSCQEIAFRALNVSKLFIEKIQKHKKEIKLFKKFNKFFFDDFTHIRDFYASNNDLYKKVLLNADKIINHKISIFSCKNIDLGPQINWHKDYSTNKEYPLKFYSDINLTNSKYGNIKYVWELNRFQHLFSLAQAYVLSEDSKYASEIIDEIVDWIDKNPYMIGVNWTSSLELSFRLISWAWALFSLEKMNYSYKKQIKEKISTSIYQQTEFIYNHLSLYSSANNHLIGELMGLAFIGILFDYGNSSLKWKSKGIEGLYHQLNCQVNEDGLNKEQAFGYHCFTLNMFLTAFILMERNQIPIDKSFSKLEKMTDIILKFSDNEFNLPNFGDSDDSFVLKLDNYDELPIKTNAKSILNTAAILFNRPDFKFLTNSWLDENTLWIMNSSQIQKYFDLNTITPAKKSVFLKNSGYVLLKSKDIDGFLDAGNLGYLSIAAHGHADTLSLCLNYKNKEFFIDPGTYSYDCPNKWRNYFRGTSAHNTLQVDNLNQSKIGGRFLWIDKFDTIIEKIELNDKFNYVKASHNGYIKQGVSVKHTRELFFLKDKFILILDRAENFDNKLHHYSLNWHLSENCKITDKNNLLEINNNSTIIYLKTFCSSEININILQGNLCPILGWRSKNFDTKIPTNTININTKSNQIVNFISIIGFDDKIISNYNNNNKIQINCQTNNYIFDLCQNLSDFDNK